MQGFSTSTDACKPLDKHVPSSPGTPVLRTTRTLPILELWRGPVGQLVTTDHLSRMVPDLVARARLPFPSPMMQVSWPRRLRRTAKRFAHNGVANASTA